MFWNKRSKVEEMLETYEEALDEIVTKFRTVAQEFLDNGNSEEFSQGADEVSACEGRIDDSRREIERFLYGRQLLPESRGDLLGILEAVDRIPNTMETILCILADEHLEPLPELIREQTARLLDINVESYKLVGQAMRELFRNPKEIAALCSQIDAKESESDRLERRMIKAIYRSDLELARKHHLRDLVIQIGTISDRGENCADRFTIIAIKKNI